MADWKSLEADHLYGHVRVSAQWGSIHPDTVRAAATRRGWARPHRGVVRIGPGTGSDHERLAAVVVRMRRAEHDLVALSGWTACWLYGLISRLPSKVQVTVEHRRRAASLDGAKVRRSRLLEPDRITTIEGLPVLSLPWLILEMASRVSEEVLRGWLLDIRQRKLATFADLEQAAAGSSRKGAGMLRRLMRELDPEEADSAFEDRMRARLAEGGFRPDPDHAKVQTESGYREIDIAFTPELVGIECHSMGFHADRKSLEGDAIRQSEIALTDWTILYATWRDLGSGWPAFARRLRLALERAQAR